MGSGGVYEVLAGLLVLREKSFVGRYRDWDLDWMGLGVLLEGMRC